MSLVPVSQQVIISGETYQVHSASIETSINSIQRIRFAVDFDANSGASPIGINQALEFRQNCDTLEIFRGIISKVSTERGVNYTRLRVEALGFAELAARRRVYGVIGPGPAHQLIQQLWSQFVPEVALDLPPSSPNVEEIAPIYETVFEVTSAILSAAGLSWTLKDGVLRVFNPTTRPLSPQIVQTNFEAGTLIAEDDTTALYNAARMQAYRYITIDFTTPFIASRPGDQNPTGRNFLLVRANSGFGAPLIQIPIGPQSQNVNGFPNACTRLFTRGQGFNAGSLVEGIPLSEWEFVSAVALRGGIVSGQRINRLEDIEFNYREQEGLLETSVNMRPFLSLFRATFRRLVWVERLRPDSILAYGVREAPTLPTREGTPVNEAIAELDNFLDQRSEPALNITGSFLRSDIEPGERRFVSLPDLGVSGEFVVVSVRKTTSGDDLQTMITLSRISTPGAGRPARFAMPRIETPPLPEILRRITRVEARGADPGSLIGSALVSQGPIRASASFGGERAWSGEFVVQVIGAGIYLSEDEI